VFVCVRVRVRVRVRELASSVAIGRVPDRIAEEASDKRRQFYMELGIVPEPRKGNFRRWKPVPERWWTAH
jgi:hypothetical protein